jgi:hypothetical protein
MSADGRSRPQCFGAASRDPLHACHNPALDRVVTPTLRDAPIQPSSPCRVLRRAKPEVCTFGVAKRAARERIALIGDSHSVHWRAALDIVAHRRGWYGYSIYRSACPFSTAAPANPRARQRCVHNTRDVIAWMNGFRHVSTVVVSERPRQVVPTGGQTESDTEINGYIAAWNALPASVTKIVVIRDTPYATIGWEDCVARSLARHGRPGTDCREPRATTLWRDPALLAAQRLTSPRVQVVDLTPFFCDQQYCYPVIGGVLVHKGTGHITRTYSETLGPYLDRALSAVLAPGR